MTYTGGGPVPAPVRDLLEAAGPQRHWEGAAAGCRQISQILRPLRPDPRQGAYTFCLVLTL
jgi:hypothetical protein